jgi:hypothetical protein
MTTEFNITAAAIATLISAGTSASISLLINGNNKKKSLDDQLDGILKIAIQYPYLESEPFCKGWTPTFNKEDEKYLRYEVYCILMFNFLCRISHHYKFDKKKIENYIAIKEWVRLHATYWNNPASSYENVDNYDTKFVDLINSYLR